MTVKRIRHGWTPRDGGESYPALLHDEVFPGIEGNRIEGYRGIGLLHLDHADEAECMTIITFDSLQSTIDFQGPECTRCHVADAAQKLLPRRPGESARCRPVGQRGCR